MGPNLTVHFKLKYYIQVSVDYRVLIPDTVLYKKKKNTITIFGHCINQKSLFVNGSTRASRSVVLGNLRSLEVDS